jgi:predicted nucleic-acid-binding Zn-ribbon protein
MQRTLKCPKCGGAKIWVIERFRVPSETAEGQELAVVPHQQEMGRGLFAIARISPRGHFDLYACDGCGYAELYARDLAGLEPDPDRGIRLVDATEPQKGPFR